MAAAVEALHCCPVPSCECSKQQGFSGFREATKLREHLNKKHSDGKVAPRDVRAAGFARIVASTTKPDGSIRQHRCIQTTEATGGVDDIAAAQAGTSGTQDKAQPATQPATPFSSHNPTPTRYAAQCCPAEALAAFGTAGGSLERQLVTAAKDNQTESKALHSAFDSLNSFC